MNSKRGPFSSFVFALLGIIFSREFLLSALRGILTAVILLVIACIQSSFFTYLKPLGAIPDIMLAAVAVFGFFCKKTFGAVCGVVGGFFITALGAGGFSLSPIILTVCGFAAGLSGQGEFLVSISHRNGKRQSFRCILTVIFIASLLKSLFNFAIICLSSAKLSILSIFIDIILPEIIITMLFSAIIYLFIKPIAVKISRQ